MGDYGDVRSLKMLKNQFHQYFLYDLMIPQFNGCTKQILTINSVSEHFSLCIHKKKTKKKICHVSFYSNVNFQKWSCILPQKGFLLLIDVCLETTFVECNI